MNALSIIRCGASFLIKKESTTLLTRSTSNQQCIIRSIRLNQQQSIRCRRQFSTSTPKQAIPPLLWMFLKPITKLGAILAGRGFRKWWTALPQMKKQIFIDHLKRNRTRYGLFTTISGGSMLAFYQSHLEYTPITHRKRFVLFKNYQLKEIESIEKENVKLLS